MPLQVAVGHSSLTGPRERNEDYCGVATPDGQTLENKGILAAVADGIGGHGAGARRPNTPCAACSPTTTRRPIPGACRVPSTR